MKSYIIGIAGELNSGKDTLASMINYIVAEGTTKANYQKWLTQKVKYDLTYADRITHFADPMKDCLSIMFSISRPHFDERKYKDDMWYVIEEQRFITEAEACIGGRYEKVTLEMLLHKPLSHWIGLRVHDNRKVIIKLRTLMQYFGTEIGRKQLGNNLWLNATIFRAAAIAETRKICIIPDVRFSNENNAIRSNSLYGGDIYIHRDQNGQDRHESEVIDFTCKYTVDNNGTKMQLFYKAIAIVKYIIK